MEAEAKCPQCGCDVPPERVEILGVKTCTKCTPQPKRLYGVMSFNHKTGGELMLTDDRKMFEFLKRPINKQR